MTERPMHAGLKAALEFGPIVGFLVVYLIFRNDSFSVAGTDYTGIVAVTALFVPIFLLSAGALWYLSGTIARMQVVAMAMLIFFGGLSVWFNDPRFFQMKPTAIYLFLGLILGVGLLRGKALIQYVMEDTIPLKEKGWMILTKRMTLVCFLSAGANEVVWRTQSEETWVLFETLAMPVLIFAFFLAQIPLFVDYATFKRTEQTKR